VYGDDVAEDFFDFFLRVTDVDRCIKVTLIAARLDRLPQRVSHIGVA
jgi:hypothetical protein